MTVNRIRRLLALAGAVLMLVSATAAYAATDGAYSTYTYNYDYWGEVRESPNAYEVDQMIYSSTLGLDVPMSSPQSLFARGNRLWVVDRGNNRILELERVGWDPETLSGGSFELVRIIDHAVVTPDKREEYLAGCDLLRGEDGAPFVDEEGNYYLRPAADSTAERGPVILAADGTTVFNYPNDVAVGVLTDENGVEAEYMWIADTSNNRVLMIDSEGRFVRQFLKPSDPTFDQAQAFQPNKIVVDTSGRVFVLATNVNKGLVKFEADGSFTGFIGANQVTYNMWDYIWKTFFTTKEQRSQQASFVPTEYRNIYIDHEGFIYATNTSFSEYDLLYDNAKPIRRLNAIGTDILIKNDRYPPIGDYDWVEQSTDHGPSKFYDITVLDNDMYVAIDQTRGRLFGYDPQGIMLWAFGMGGVSSEGSFTRAVSIEHMGRDLIVLDELDCSLTVFTPTAYGLLIFKASDEYLAGLYDQSAQTWEEVRRLNMNYNLAIIGIGRAEMREAAEEHDTGKRMALYQSAMDHFKMAHDRDNYGRAFRYYRKDWVEKNIWWIVILVTALLIIPMIRRMIQKAKWEVAAYESRQVKK